MKDADIRITGGTLLSMDGSGDVLDGGAVVVRGDTIVALGKADDINRTWRAKKTITAENCIVMPGLVNAHTHAAMTCFRGIADDRTLMDWLNNFIFPAEAKNVNPDLAYWGSLLACAEMIRSGTTTFCDMYIFEDETARAAAEAGMRCLLGEVLFDFPSPSVKTPAEGITYTRLLLDRWAGHPLVNIVVEPHALYTCSPPLLKDAKALADEYGAPLAMHLLENGKERIDLEARLGTRATRFLKDLGLLDERFFAFHCVAVDGEDMDILADHGCGIVHNPESNMKLASGVAPVTAMLERGITVALGTDGAASNNNLDMFAEMDTAAKLEKVARLDPTIMPAPAVLRMATRDGAAVLGMGHITGSLEPGKKADIIIIDMNKPHLTPLYNAYSHLVYAVRGDDVITSIINGRIVMEDRRLTTIDEEAVMGRVRDIARRVQSGLTGS